MIKYVSALMAAASNQINSTTPDARIICGRYLSTTDQPRSFRDIQNSLNVSKVEAEDGQEEENYQESRGGYR